MISLSNVVFDCIDDGGSLVAASNIPSMISHLPSTISTERNDDAGASGDCDQEFHLNDDFLANNGYIIHQEEDDDEDIKTIAIDDSIDLDLDEENYIIEGQTISKHQRLVQ